MPTDVMRRPSSTYGSSFAFGPGPLSPTLKALIAANVVMFVVQMLAAWTFGKDLTWWLGLMPAAVLHSPFKIWQLATYMFLHASLLHILFNMLALWMFGTELERIWGTRYFLKFYLLTGIGAACLTVLFSLLPFGLSRELNHSIVIGASGAIYGLLLAYGLYFPDRPIYMYLVFPIPAKYFVLIIGAIAFYSSLSDNNGVANATHLGGLLVGYLLLKGARFHPLSEAKYWYLRWKMNRVRRKFDVYQGGRSDDWKRRVH
jgi:membrane associated rhomboid family serine protease